MGVAHRLGWPDDVAVADKPESGLSQFPIDERAERANIAQNTKVEAGMDGATQRLAAHSTRVCDSNGRPLFDTYSAHYERDHARWEGTQGESIGVRLPAAVTRQLMHDEADHFDLQTRCEVADMRLSRLVLDLADEVQGAFPNGRLYRAKPDLSCKGGGLTTTASQTHLSDSLRRRTGMTPAGARKR